MAEAGKSGSEEVDKKVEEKSEKTGEEKKATESTEKKEESKKDPQEGAGSKEESKTDAKGEEGKSQDGKPKEEKKSAAAADKSGEEKKKASEDNSKEGASAAAKDDAAATADDDKKTGAHGDEQHEEDHDDEHQHEERDFVDEHGVEGGNDREEADETARRTFLTQKEPEERPNIYAFNEVLFPKGHPAKLCKVLDADSDDLRVGEIIDNYKINDPTPVILLAGAHNDSRQSLMAGVCRAAYRTGATIIDSGVSSSIEKFCIKKKVPLMGVIPDSQIIWPKINATTKNIDELTDGRSHIFSIAKKSRKATWGDEADFKTNLAIRLSKGRIQYVNPACKVIVLCLGDNPHCLDEMALYAECGWPIIVIPGSDTSNKLLEAKEAGTSTNSKIKDIVSNGKIFECPQEFGSEELASLVHLHLTITIEQPPLPEK